MLCWYRIRYTSVLGRTEDEIRCRNYTSEQLKNQVSYCNSLDTVELCKVVPERCARKLFPKVVWNPPCDFNWPKGAC